MSNLYSKRVERIKPSPTLAITARAAALKASGKDIIGLGAGEPDFDTPIHIKEAAIQAIKDGFTKYTPVGGTPQLKNAIIHKFQRDNNISYLENQVLASTGGKQCIFNLTQALLDDGDEVIIPAPYWVSYPDIVLLANAKPVIVSTNFEQGFKITAEQLDNHINDNTKMVFLNSPSNPTGMAYNKEELLAIGEVLRKYPKIFIATDDMYEHILWPEKKPFINILMACPDLYDRTVVLNGVSKAYSMTGWRIGFAAGPAELIKRMQKIQGQSTSNPTSISQVAAEAALKGSLDCVTEMVTEFKKRHDFVVDKLNKIPNIKCLAGDGTFYAFPDVTDLIAKLDINTDVELVEKLIEEANIAFVPGTAFGCPGFLRLSFATSIDNLSNALNRFEEFISKNT